MGTEMLTRECRGRVFLDETQLAAVSHGNHCMPSQAGALARRSGEPRDGFCVAQPLSECVRTEFEQDSGMNQGKFQPWRGGI